MREYSIAAIPADGIGPEVIAAGVQVLESLQKRLGDVKFNVETFDWGSAYYRKHGAMMPADGLATLKKFDAIYFGAVGAPDVPDHITLWGLRLPICQGFDQYANVRPTRILPGITSPLRNVGPGDLDWRKFLTVVTKSNAQRHGMVMWDEIAEEVSKEFPDVTWDKMLVDAMTVRMTLKPQSLDTIVATNLHADILSDLAGALAGSLGVAPTANIDPERRFPSMFEPIHGSAFDITGKGIANPVASFWTASQMLDHLGEAEASVRLMRAVEQVTGAGITTPDVGGTATTKDVTAAVVEAIHSSNL
jgi:tartrate dehydrogenase/decarboxylase/D-malate dehydrogenase